MKLLFYSGTMFSSFLVMKFYDELMWTVKRCYQKEGLVQSYATSRLPSSVFRSRVKLVNLLVVNEDTFLVIYFF